MKAIIKTRQPPTELAVLNDIMSQAGQAANEARARDKVAIRTQRRGRREHAAH